MAKIPNSVVPNAYIISKKVFNKEISRKEGRTLIIAAGVENANSATDYIDNFRYLLEGKIFHRDLNSFSLDFFLKKINEDYGCSKLAIALKALDGFIQYHKENGRNKNYALKIYNKYNSILNLDEDELEQEEIINEFKKTSKTIHDIIIELKNLKPSDPKMVFTNSSSYKRDNRTIASLKYLRGFKCQICSTQILKKDDNFYIEAAHIVSKNKKGPETPDNILILCPNHHKEFDYGNRKITSHSKDQITFTMNGKEYKLSLKLELSI